MAPSRIVELATKIQENTTKIDEYLTANKLPSPSFAVDGPLAFDFPEDIANARAELLAATDELHWLTQGPIENALQLSVQGSASLRAIHRFKIASAFPLNETATFAQIAEKVGLPEIDVRRILRHAMTDHFFAEPQEGVVAHTAATSALINIPLLDQWCGATLEELWPAKAHLVDALVKWPGSQEPEHSGFSLAQGIDRPFFDEVNKDPRRAQRFKEAMTFFQNAPGFESSHVLEGFDWSSVGLMVDIGGSSGSICIELVKKYPNLRAIVQDQAEVIKEATSSLSEALKDRVSFREHDFFTEQPVKDADLYFLRWILHDWSDKYALKILRGIIPALKKGARVLINEFCLPPVGMLSYFEEKLPRNFDFILWGSQNALERSAGDWVKLLADADPRFKVESVNIPPKSKLALISVVWDA